MKYRYSIRWSSGKTGLIRWNRQWIESQSVQRILFKTVFIIYLEYAKDFHLFFIFLIFFYRVFFTSKKYALKRL
jgi:hypothetical protein